MLINKKLSFGQEKVPETIRKFPSEVQIASKRFSTVVKRTVGSSLSGGDGDIVDGVAGKPSDFSIQLDFFRKELNCGGRRWKVGVDRIAG